MRWKLLIAASLLAAAAGFCTYLAASHVLFMLWPLRPPAWEDRVLPLTPFAAIIFASIFVYRHTPRRRALQAVVTAVFASLLTLLALLALYATANIR